MVVALESDFKTIYGANFDHKSETPGLGAEIKYASYSDQILEKQYLTQRKLFNQSL